MSIVLASRLSASDLALLGNNLAEPAAARCDRPRSHRRSATFRGELSAVNRSLAAVVGERVGRLLLPPSVATPAAGVGR